MKHLEMNALRAKRRAQNRAIVFKWRLLALSRGHRLEIVLTGDPVLFCGISLVLPRSGTSRLSIGSGSRIEGGSIIRLGSDARISIGQNCIIRSGAILNVTGRLDLAGDNLISWGAIIHCAESVIFERMAGTGDYVTVVDSTHYRADVDDHWYHRSKSAPVRIGENTWLSSKSTVARGVTLGAAVTVGAHSYVDSNFDDCAVVAGSPARLISTARYEK